MTIVLSTSPYHSLVHYTVKFRSRILATLRPTLVNSHWVAHAPAHKIIARPSDLNEVEYTVWSGLCFRGESIAPKYRLLTNWNEASTASGTLWVMRSLIVLLASGVSVQELAFFLEADIFIICDVMWCWDDFFETINDSRLCRHSVNISINCTLNWCVYNTSGHFEFPKVVQAHTLGEMVTVCTVLVRVYSGTILRGFIEISLYLTNMDQKNKLAQLRYCVYTELVWWS